MNVGDLASAIVIAAMGVTTVGPQREADHSVALRDRLAASERSYIGYTRQELFGAAERVLGAIGPSRILEPSDADLPARAAGGKSEPCLLVAQPQRSLYRWDMAYWDVCLVDRGGNTIAMQVSATEQRADGLLPQYLPPFKAAIPVLADGGLTPVEARLFFERVDLQLQNKAKAWMTCTRPTSADKLKPVGHFICRGGVISGSK